MSRSYKKHLIKSRHKNNKENYSKNERRKIKTLLNNQIKIGTKSDDLKSEPNENIIKNGIDYSINVLDYNRIWINDESSVRNLFEESLDEIDKTWEDYSRKHFGIYFIGDFIYKMNNKLKNKEQLFNYIKRNENELIKTWIKLNYKK